MSSLKASGETKVSNGMSKIEPAWPLLDGSIVHMTKSQCKYVTARSQLGDGNFSVVKECMNVQTNERYAMKLIPKRLVRGRLRLIQREVAVLKLASARVHELEERNREGEGRSSDNWGTFEGHHHVLQLFDYFETRDNIVLVTQLCEQGDLYDRIINAGSLDVERQVKPYTACLLSALSFLHENGIVHRDIKAENILFRLHEREAPENAKYDVRAHDLIVADFGLAVSKDDIASLKEYVGTLSYLAPEVVRCKDAYKLPAHESEQVKIYGTGIDVWALGVLCYFMVSGYMPFDCEEDAETSECILQGDYYVDEEAQSEASESFKQCWNFMQQCFTCDDRVRPSAKDLMGHVFVRSYFQSVEAKVFSEIPFMEKSKSSTSLHNLGPPTRSPMVSPRVSFREQKGIPRADSRERNLNKLRDTLRKTLSMTSLEPMSTRSGLFAALAAVDPNRKNSTFVLEPEPPSQSLMNGCYSITPESQSNFHVTPSMSRKSSGNNVLESNNTTVFMSVPGKQCFTMPAMDTAMAGGRARSTAFHLGDDDDDHY